MSNKIVQVALLIIMLASGCGPDYGPVGTFMVTTPVHNPTPPSRLTVGKDGSIFDTEMNQACTWALDDKCVKRCFPVERMWPACGTAHGEHLLYTRQGLTQTFAFGRQTTIQSPACSGNEVNVLLDLTFLDNNTKPSAVCDCTNKNQDLSLNLYDRAWYKYAPSALSAATIDDLPSAS